MFLRSLGIICYDRWVLREGHKNYFRDRCLINSQLLCRSLFNNVTGLRLLQSYSFGFISTDPTICCTVTFASFGNSGHAAISLSIYFPSNSTQSAIACLKLTIEHENKVWNMFKVNSKDTRATSMASFWCLFC